MQSYDRERIFRRVMRRTDVLRAVAVGVLLGVCVIVSAYVSLSAGLFAGIGALLLLTAFWSYTRQKRQRPIADKLTLPALSHAFEQPVYTLPAALPAEEAALLFPGCRRVRCRDQLTASRQGLSFTFANALITGPDRRPLFHGQWLTIHTDWQLPGTILLREHLPEDAPETADPLQTLPAVDSAFLRACHVETDAPQKAACVLACPLLRAMLLRYPGTRLHISGATVRLAIPSDELYFELTGLEESAAQVAEAQQRHIAAIQAWLDAVLAVEMPIA